MDAVGTVIEAAAPRPGSRRRSVRRVAATALLVSASYYVGASVGFVLRLPASTPSIFWPPNAILTATLLLSPVQRWWIYLLVALPAHLVAQLAAGRPLVLALALFATNCMEALVAAICVRRFSDAPARFDTLRRVAIFIGGAALVAPLLSSFVDAAAVSWLRHEPYWLVWRTRFFSNVLTELTLVPAIVTVITVRSSWRRGIALRRYVEAAALALAIVIVGALVVVGPIYGPHAIPHALYTPLALLLPFILWATVRFGPAGASLSLLCTALLAILVNAHLHRPLTTLPPAESVANIQIFLSVTAIPLMCLAAVIEERRRFNEALAERLRFEELLVRLSSTFVHLPSQKVETVFEASLQQLGLVLGLERITLYRLFRDTEEFVAAYSWSVGVRPVPHVSVIRDFPWITAQLLRERPVAVSSPEQLPPEAARDAETLRRRGVRANLAIPMVAGGRIIGCLAFVTFEAERTWPDELVQRLRLVGEIFANALAQREAEDSLRESETMKSAILASLSSNVAVLDRGGRIVTANDGWMRFAREHGATSETSVGANYLDHWRRAADKDSLHPSDALAGMEAVLDGSSAGFSIEYPSRSSGSERWFEFAVVPLNVPEGGAVVSRTDVTERKLAELEAQRSRQELAHFTRVSTIGELTASLAHELNQPLTAILANAQAALRLLRGTRPNLVEIQSILSDIVNDDSRAGEVIRRLRALLRKGDSQFRQLDLNALIRDVAKLLSTDAMIRNVAVTLELDPKLAPVRGDGVQLQQVVLNLLLNAMEAMSEGIVHGRTLTVRSEHTDTRTVHVLVQDAGTGLRQETLRQVFQPFYTTKSSGMGMGLAISKSIIEAHGGLIWVTNNATAGATFHFSLPIADMKSA